MIVGGWQEIEDATIDLCVTEFVSAPNAEDFVQVTRVLKSGRRLVCLVKDNLNAAAAKTLFYSQQVLRFAELAGLGVRHHIIWHDPTHAAKWLAGKGFPHGPSVVVNHNISDIWVFQKRDTWTSHLARYTQLPESELPYDIMDRDFFDKYVRTSVWTRAGTMAKDEGYPSAPIELFASLIRMWSRPLETVLDIQPHTGNVGIAALRWHRKPLLMTQDEIETESLAARLESERMNLARKTILGLTL